jgi:phosphoglycolate phosphatase-like HAD superfamily hydrolase
LYIGTVSQEFPDDARDLDRSDRAGDTEDDPPPIEQARGPTPDRSTGVHSRSLRGLTGAEYYLLASARRLNVWGPLRGAMTPGSSRPPPDAAPEPVPVLAAGSELPLLNSTSQFAEVGHTIRGPREVVTPRTVDRGVVVFDLDGTILDDLGLISTVAADLLEKAFATPEAEGRIHYLATTGMPFEAQLAQLYPSAPAELRASTARTFHQRKVVEAYAKAKPFPEIPGLLKRLDQERWTMVISTGSETEMADLILEREGLRFWFEEVLGSADGTKREHLTEYRRRYPGVPMFLVGDSRFDMEAAHSVEGVVALGRASSVRGWSLTPADLEQWGAAWSEYSLSELPATLSRLTQPKGDRTRRAPAPRRRR